MKERIDHHKDGSFDIARDAANGAIMFSAMFIASSASIPAAAEPIEACPHFRKRFVHSPGRRRTSRCDISRHGVALLCGISTPSLPAQGGQRRPLQKFNRTRDNPEKERRRRGLVT
jgi:hypothetical protein